MCLMIPFGMLVTLAWSLSYIGNVRNAYFPLSASASSLSFAAFATAAWVLALGFAPAAKGQWFGFIRGIWLACGLLSQWSGTTLGSGIAYRLTVGTMDGYM